MTERQYVIGEFAAVNKITPRILRHYDKIGLLKPDAILENGYRVYTSAQIARVSHIRQLQSCGFTLAEVQLLLDADEAQVRQAAKIKLTELDKHDQTQQLARAQLLEFVALSTNSFRNQYDISYTWQSELLLFSCEAPVTEAEIEASIERLYCAIAAQGVFPDGHCLLLADLRETDAYRVAVPVKEKLNCNGFECITLEAGWYLSTTHHGDYSSIGMAYDRLICYAEENGHSLQSLFHERYLLDGENTASPAQYYTQIFVRLTP
ncbi:MerR family transcriptional regulator [Hungatella hathewayi]|uniref:MerR family transcriptional regulator n=1 Tax=Hungatella hathewayi TaxID=154046 RepID=UPI00356160FF